MTDPNTTPKAMSRAKATIITVAAASIAIVLIAGSVIVWHGKEPSTTGSSATTGSSINGIADHCEDVIEVTASVNQWGSLAKELGGGCVTVTSIINSTSADPHGYEASPSDLTKITQADIVLINGAGYDSWAQSTPSATQNVINVGILMGITATEEEGHDDEEEGHHHHHGDVNPHLWFSPDAVLKTASALTAAYIKHFQDNPNAQASVQRRSNAWNSDYAEFVAMVNKARNEQDTRNYAATESIADLLMTYIGAVNNTPGTYLSAAANDAEPSASDLKAAMDVVAGPTVDVLIVNPQELDGFAEKLQSSAKNGNKTIVSVSEQLPENSPTLLEWLSLIAQQTLANDTYNGFFLTQDVKDRSLNDYAGAWQSVYPLLKEGSLKEVMQAKAAAGSMNEKEYTEYYDIGYKTDVSSITISSNTMSFSRGDSSVSATYSYDGFRILDYAKGNRGVRYLFTAVGVVPDGAPKVVQFSDHGISSEKSAHFHIFMGEDSQEQTLKEMDNWPTYYPSTLTTKEVVTEMLAH
jgi:zinc transport system substrate-binding protein